MSFQSLKNKLSKIAKYTLITFAIVMLLVLSFCKYGAEYVNQPPCENYADPVRIKLGNDEFHIPAGDTLLLTFPDGHKQHKPYSFKMGEIFKSGYCQTPNEPAWEVSNFSVHPTFGNNFNRDNGVSKLVVKFGLINNYKVKQLDIPTINEIDPTKSCSERIKDNNFCYVTFIYLKDYFIRYSFPLWIQPPLVQEEIHQNLLSYLSQIHKPSISTSN